MGKHKTQRMDEIRQDYEERCQAEKEKTDIWIRGFKAGAKAVIRQQDGQAQLIDPVWRL